jgi:hypothetical protein
MHENITTEDLNSEVVGKLLEEISTLQEVICALQNERIQDMRLQEPQANKNGWDHVSKGILKKRKTSNPTVFSSSEK